MSMKFTWGKLDRKFYQKSRETEDLFEFFIGFRLRSRETEHLFEFFIGFRLRKSYTRQNNFSFHSRRVSGTTRISVDKYKRNYMKKEWGKCGEPL